jgi:hypothetical protein
MDRDPVHRDRERTSLAPITARQRTTRPASASDPREVVDHDQPTATPSRGRNQTAAVDHVAAQRAKQPLRAVRNTGPAPSLATSGATRTPWAANACVRTNAGLAAIPLTPYSPKARRTGARLWAKPRAKRGRAECVPARTTGTGAPGVTLRGLPQRPRRALRRLLAPWRACRGVRASAGERCSADRADA